MSKELELAKKLMGAPEFVSYNGAFPNLCSGKLVVKVRGRKWVIERLESGGRVTFDENWSENVSKGPWSISEWPKGFPEEYKEDVVKLVNEEVSLGCCGGCV